MRGYQRRALAWMAMREACAAEPEESRGVLSTGKLLMASPTAVWNGTPHPSWQRILLPSGLPFYNNYLTGTPILHCLHHLCLLRQFSCLQMQKRKTSFLPTARIW